MTTTTIQYAHLIHGTEETGEWTGEESDALRAAVGQLDAVLLGDGDYAYCAEETDEWYRVSESDMLDAGAAILDGAVDWYSLWCATCGEELDAAGLAEVAS